MAVSKPFDVTAKHTYAPATRCRSVHAMKRSKPSIVDGGGEMNRATSSVVTMANSDAASEARNSRSTTCRPVSTGSCCCQLLLTWRYRRRLDTRTEFGGKASFP